ncbi:NADH:flavin oxidoreductase/NADH oxidase [Falsiroseomonas sp. HW251]|uniref:NADH:flavin oxidoreductase/NADH oxidase n=1 Tax=Falsiroseomonas sp. HW251 TaxID=3390998 RepID=UPI003D31BAE1
MPSLLFSSIRLRGLTLPNRIVIAPMCQFSARDGNATDWHLIHLGHLALSGAGLLMIEATAVEPRGRISRECLGLYNDENEAALARVLAVAREYSRMPIGLQLGHAGRKGSLRNPADGKGRGHATEAEGGWQVLGPSAIPFAPDWPTPREMDRRDMDEAIAAFVATTRRCIRLDIDLLEIHGAHGYLLSSFLSPIANRRQDAYGGSPSNRMRFPLEVFEAVRAAWPEDRPLGVRFNGTDWDGRGIGTEEAAAFGCALGALGCDFVDVSTGGNSFASIPSGPGYQVRFASKVREAGAMPTMAVGLIREPAHAEAILAAGQADMIAIGRGFLNDPRWPWHAAEALGVSIEVPFPYSRAATRADVPSYGR